MATDTLFDRLVASLWLLRSPDAGGAALAATLAVLAQSLAQRGENALSANSSRPEIEAGAAAFQASARLRPAGFALASRGSIPIAANELRNGLAEIAAHLVISALDRLGPAAFAQAATAESGSAPEMPKLASGGAPTDLAALDNIAAYHREHERYYTVHVLERAADLAREANKLKVLVDVWRAGAATPDRKPGGPDFAVMGCDDLNALPAIAGIGILFMEGQGEPAEIRSLKAKLKGLAAGTAQSGQWLADAMASAWSRESALLSEATVAAALPRYRTIVTNWVGAQETALVGRLAALAAAQLEAINFTPAALRADKPEAARRLESVARVMDIAMRLQASSAVDLSRNDAWWTEYRARLADLDALRAGGLSKT